MSNKEEQSEYDNFMISLSQKASEIDHDYKKLSEANKIKFQREVEKIITVQGISGVLQYIKMKR